MAENLLETAPAAPGAGRPADVPEKFWDAEQGTVRVDALLKSYLSLEKRLSERAGPPGADASPDELQRFRRAMGVPDSPEGYSIEAKHELCGPDHDVNCRLHEAGFTPAQAQLVYDMAAERLMPLIAEAASHYEAQRQGEKLAAHFGGHDRFRVLAPQIANWGKANLPPGVYEALCTTCEGVMAMHGMMSNGEPALMSKGGQADGPMDEQALRQMMRDPRYWRAREPEFVKRVTEGFRRLVGN
ncbi:hypothetical protein IAI18_22620 [Acetobacteraceae bacterium H6797]|nr:hypothetical protein [Acetobacteraceae bacterium H6797]